MKCLKCTKQAKIPFPNGNLCQNCFLEVLINRIKRATKANPFKKNDRVLVFGKLAETFLKKTIKLPLKITTTNKQYDRIKDLSKYDKIVIPWTADDEAELFFSQITKKKPNFEENKKIIKLFRNVLDKELLEASKILKIKFNIKQKDQKLQKIHEKFHNSIFALNKTSEEFRKAIK